MENKTPLDAFLDSYAARGALRFHMPGHKGKNFAYLPAGFAARDITEIPGADNLAAPEGILADMQQHQAAHHGAAQALALVNGSTAGILAAMLALAGPGKRVAIARDAHKSVLSALVLSGAIPVWLPVPIDGRGRRGAVGEGQLEEAFKRQPDIAAVFMTRPGYDGACGDAAAWARVCRRYGARLFVDEAHGAHFGAHPALPRPAGQLGADVWVQSAHKTLPAPGQTAWLYARDEAVGQRLAACLHLVQTTSPSYVLLSGMAGAQRLLEQQGAERLEGVIAACRAFDAGMRQAGLADGPMPPGVVARDVTRLVADGTARGQTGEGMAAWLEQHGIVPEMAEGSRVVLIATLADAPGEIDAAAQVLMALPHGPGAPLASAALPPPGNMEMIPREAFFAPGIRVPLAHAAGRIARQAAGAYPPGIPVIVPGERIQTGHIDYLSGQPSLFGVDGGMLDVIQ
nr:aminotransferase class I/II-fold pyridoxal phosphate-dependent enzyme [bacterium]